MAYTIKDRIMESSSTTGTGDFSLAAAITGFRRFQAAYSVDSGTSTFPYVIEHASLNEWEVGISYLTSSTTIKRAGSQTVLASSNSNNAVNFSVGNKLVYVTAPAQWLSDLAKLNAVQEYTKQQTVVMATLTDASSISWNLDNAQVAKVTLGGNRTLSNPINLKSGGVYILHVYQDGTGGRTLSYGSSIKWPENTSPPLSSSAGSHDILTFTSDGTYLFGAYQIGYTV